jgi:hypothetical protein
LARNSPHTPTNKQSPERQTGQSGRPDFRLRCRQAEPTLHLQTNNRTCEANICQASTRAPHESGILLSSTAHTLGFQVGVSLPAAKCDRLSGSCEPFARPYAPAQSRQCDSGRDSLRSGLWGPKLRGARPHCRVTCRSGCSSVHVLRATIVRLPSQKASCPTRHILDKESSLRRLEIQHITKQILNLSISPTNVCYNYLGMVKRLLLIRERHGRQARGDECNGTTTLL